MKPQILIVEDEPGIADTLRYALRTEGFEPHWFATGEEALAALRVARPGAGDPRHRAARHSGFDVFKRLRERSDVPVVFLTARSDEIDRVVGLELGADDYVAKPFSPRELVARVRTILRRAQQAAPRSAEPAPPARRSRSTTASARSASTAALLELSRYEYGLLQTLVARPGRVYSRDELLELVWDDASDSLDRTVDAHVKTLRAKLKAVAPASSRSARTAAAATRWPKTCRTRP